MSTKSKQSSQQKRTHRHMHTHIHLSHTHKRNYDKKRVANEYKCNLHFTQQHRKKQRATSWKLTAMADKMCENKAHYQWMARKRMQHLKSNDFESVVTARVQAQDSKKKHNIFCSLSPLDGSFHFKFCTIVAAATAVSAPESMFIHSNAIFHIKSYLNLLEKSSHEIAITFALITMTTHIVNAVCVCAGRWP